MKRSGKKNKTGTRIAIFFIALLLPVGFIHCSRNNTLDPNAGNYDAGTNILQNPGFENGGVPWQMPISGGRSIVIIGSQSGTFCEQMDLYYNFPRAVWQTVPVGAGKLYSVSGWIKTESVITSAQILVLWYNTVTPPQNQMPTGFIKADTVGSLTGTKAWTKVSRNYYAPDAALTAQLFLEGVQAADSGNGTAWFDNLSFNSH
jgi:hypothetical protein